MQLTAIKMKMRDFSNKNGVPDCLAGIQPLYIIPRRHLLSRVQKIFLCNPQFLHDLGGCLLY